MELEGKVALVTGGNRGIGKAVTTAFAREGTKVMIANLDRQSAEETASELVGQGYEVANVKTDVSKEEDAVNAVKETVERFGRLDILVNNAGVILRGLVVESTERDIDHLFNVNVKGTFLMSREAAKVMVEQGDGGRIINTSSIAGKVGIANQSIYCATKAAVDSFTKVLAAELGSHGITVNAVAPGPIFTDMTVELRKDQVVVDWLLGHTPLGRFGMPEEIADIFVFLASDGGNYITGEIIYADGGRGSTFLLSPE